MPRATTASVRARLRSLAERLERGGAAPKVVVQPDSPEQAAVYLRELRFLADRLKAVEARHVSRGLADSTFPFKRAQDELALVRDEFALLARRLARGWSDGLEVARVGEPCEASPEGSASARRELLDLAYLVKHAPLTDPAELDEIRRARAARAARAEAPVA